MNFCILFGSTKHFAAFDQTGIGERLRFAKPFFDPRKVVHDCFGSTSFVSVSGGQPYGHPWAFRPFLSWLTPPFSYGRRWFAKVFLRRFSVI